VNNLPFIIITMILALGMSAFFSSAEIAFTAVNRNRLEQLVQAGNHRAKSALLIAEKYDQYSSALLLGNGLVNIYNSAMTTLITVNYLAPLLNQPLLATTIGAILIFFLIVIVGELIPKMVGKLNALTLSQLYVMPVTVLRIVFTPFVLIVAILLLPIKWVVLKKRKENRTQYNDDELETMVDTIEAQGIIDEKKGDLIRSALNFSDKKAYEVMTPRVDIFAFNLEEDSQHLLLHPDIFSYSRIPVYDQTLDKVVGILPTKRLYKRFLRQTPIDLGQLLVTPLFVPRNQPLKAVLDLFKEHKQQMAIVVDEHGGTEGIITLEDIIEELVGEIWDETDDILPPIIKQNDYEYIVEGSLNIEVLFSELELPYEETSDYATVSGWVLATLGKFATVGDRFTYQGIEVIVLEIEKFTVEKIKVILPQDEERELSTKND
jgi:putative hemolysin